jgi:hypothetical protein
MFSTSLRHFQVRLRQSQRLPYRTARLLMRTADSLMLVSLLMVLALAVLTLIVLAYVVLQG